MNKMNSGIQINYFYGVSSKKCNRLEMEDVYNIKNINNILYYVICDGHGSALIPDYIAKNFVTLLDKFLRSREYNFNEVRSYIYQLCEKLDENIKNTFSSYDYAGTTMVCLFFYQNHFYVVNIGDSVIMISKNNKIYFKNIEHKPNERREKRRILQTQTPIINNRINGVINISRSFGDFLYKTNKTKYFNPIISIPNINYFNIDSFLNQNTWFLLASDGLFLYHDYTFIYSVINYMLKIDYKPQVICDLIVDFYEENHYEDNVTLIIILLDNFIIDIDKRCRFLNIKKEISYELYNIIKTKTQNTLYTDKKSLIENEYIKYIKKYSKIEIFILYIIRKNILKYILQLIKN